MFDALEARGVDYGRVLDTFAGSGALGIEALSRGDGRCDFIESNAKAAAVIRENLRATGLDELGRVHRFRVEQAPARLDAPYSLVFADPPYDDEAAVAAVEAIADSPLVGSTTTLVLEQSGRSEASEHMGTLHLEWNRSYGDTQVSIYEEATS
jgi:16S rRNA (guanine966-N2)-methyltransferase